MNNGQFDLLLEMLNSRTPLIGGWLRRRAARRLAQSATPQAIQALAEALTTNSDAKVQAIAKEAILNAQTQPAIDRICQVWAASRQPWLAQTVQQKRWVASRPAGLRLLCLLLTDQLDEILDGEGHDIAHLVAACQDAEARLAQQARSCLARLRRPAAVNALCAEWARSRAALLEAAVIEGRYVARQPAALRVLSALKSGQAQLLLHGSPAVVQPLLQAVQDADPQIAEMAGQTLRLFKKAELRDALCNLFIEDELPLAGQIALECGYLPQDVQRRALFFFLTGQWQPYLEIDFDQRVLRTAYQAASPALRRRILENVRASGRAELLKAISGREVLVLTSSESAFIAQMLIDGQDWPRLWERIGEFSFETSLHSVRSLYAAGWQPEQAQEAALLAELAELAGNEVETSSERIRSYLPPAVLRARVKLTSGRINELSFSPARPVIAIGTSQRRVAEWDFQSSQRRRLWGGFNASIGQVAYSATDELVVSERSNSQKPCQVYRAFGTERRQIFESSKSFTFIEPAGAARVLLGSRDRKLDLLDLSTLSIVASRSALAFWPRSARISPTGDCAALLHEEITFARLPDLAFMTSKPLSPAYKGIPRCAAFSPNGEELAIGKTDGLVLALPAAGAGSERLLARHSQRVLAIESLRKRELLVSLSSDGELRFSRWANSKMAEGDLAGKIQLPDPQVTSMHISGDGAFMALGNSQSGISLWDLRVLDVPALLEKPLANGAPEALAGLQAMLSADRQPEIAPEQAPLPAQVQRAMIFVERILRHRFRFDVEIGDVPQIITGEYDIDIDG
jgi:hypothetical protein